MGGGFISSIGAIATSDGQHILTGAATSIRIYSTTTSALVAELRGHTGDVTALVLDPHSTKKVSLAPSISLMPYFPRIVVISIDY